MPTKRKGPSAPGRKTKPRPDAAPAVPSKVPLPPIGCIDADAMAAEQGVVPVQDFEGFLDEIGDAWPDGESVDEFIAAIREHRRQGPHRSKA